MQDLLYIALGFLFTLACFGLLALCDRLMGGQR